MPNRREFLKTTVLAGAGLVLYSTFGGRKVYASVTSPGLKKFIQPLPGLGPSGIPVATKTVVNNIDTYNVELAQFSQQLHPDLPKATTLWGYADSGGVHKHLGGVIVANSGVPVRVRFTNKLPTLHPLPVDSTLPGAELAQNRASSHLHGGHVPWTSDGGPMSWFAPSTNSGDLYGPSVKSIVPATLPPGSYDVYYPNDQSARLMWYHDHAMGLTRLNAYIGLASAYLIRDAFEQNLIDTFAIPGYVPGTEIPLVIQDKVFVPNNIGTIDPSWRWGSPGDLWYAHTYDPADLAPGFSEPADPSCVPEFFGDTMLVNGLVYPTVTLEPRKYRLRILNACNARFCRLQLFYAQGPNFPDSSEPNLKAAGPAFLQIGNEAGFLPSTTGPVLLDRLLMAPAERADTIVDLSHVPVGSILILYNDAPAPFPDGDLATDYYLGSKNPTSTAPGYGPNTRTLLQIVVGPLSGPKDPKPSAPLKLLDISPLSAAGVAVRDLTLNEDFDSYGRLIQRLGTNQQLYPGTFARNYMDPPTEAPVAGSVEVWRIFNLTGDTHPIHFHLVNVQVMGRQSFHVNQHSGTSRLVGPFRPPDPNETGWKETVRMNPGEMTQVIMKFDLAPSPTPVPSSASFAQNYPSKVANEFVWHCHILEHEEHDMMRPLIVLS